ncbi:MAG: cupin domain-containing protein [Nitriliruptorales bacterium]|nr:cupin domain-containing protein [Nitriliruptorales bacterium]
MPGRRALMCPACPRAGAIAVPTLGAMDTPAAGPTAVDLRDYVDFELAAAAGRRVFTTDVVAVDLVCLEPGQVVDARTLAGADTIYTVLGGRAWVVTDEAEVTLEPLQAVVVPAGVPHGLRNDAPDPLILQVVVSPPDEMPESVYGPAPIDEPVVPVADKPSTLDRLRRALGG